MNIINGILFGCALLVFCGAKVFGRYLFEDPCEGDGNFRDPVEYYAEEESDDEEHNKTYHN